MAKPLTPAQIAAREAATQSLFSSQAVLNDEANAVKGLLGIALEGTEATKMSQAWDFLTKNVTLKGLKGPQNLVTDKTAGGYLDFLQKIFGDLKEPGMQDYAINSMKTRTDMAFNEVTTLGKQPTGQRKKELTDLYDKYKNRIDSMEKTLDHGPTVAVAAVEQQIAVIDKHVTAGTSAFEKLAAKATHSAAEKNAIGAELQKIFGAGAVKIPTNNGQNLVVELINHDTQKLEKIVLGKFTTGGGPKLTINAEEIEKASQIFQKRALAIVEQPREFFNQINEAIVKVKGELTGNKQQLDKLGELIGKRPVYTAAAAAAAPATETAVAVTEATEGLMTKADGSIAKSLDGHKIKANTLGVVGEEAGWWNRIKANVMVEENKMQALVPGGEEVVHSIKASTPKIIMRGGAIAASLGAIALGIKGFITGKTDENGQSVPSDSGDMLKNGALVVGGGIAAGLLALGKGKAMGALAK